MSRRTAALAYGAWLVVALAFAALVVTGANLLYSASLLLVLAAGAAGLRGAGGGAAAAAGLLALELAVRGASWELLYLAGVASLAVALVGTLERRLGEARGRSDATVRLLSVLVAALRAVAEAPGDREVNATLPGLLRRGGGADLRVWRTTLGAPEVVAAAGGEEGADEVVAAAVTEVLERRAPILEPRRTARGTRYLAALPVFERGDVVSVITALREQPFSAQERQAAEDFAEAVGRVLAALHERREGELVMEFLLGLEPGVSASQAAQRALELLVRELGLTGAFLMRYGAGRFRAFAFAGGGPEGFRRRMEAGLRYGNGAVWDVYHDGEALYLDDYGEHPGASSELRAYGLRSVGIVPLSGAPRCHYVLGLFNQSVRPWRSSDRALVASVNVVLRVVLGQAEAEERLGRLLQLERALLAEPGDAMYERLLATAVELVPGAEAGSLLLRRAGGDFAYAAVEGYEPEAFRTLAYAEADMIGWYGGDRDAWCRGVPRVLVSDERRTVAEVSSRTAPREVLRRAGRIDDIVANLCLPVLYEGEVLALLNLDAFHDPAAFETDALEAVAPFQPLVAFLLNEGAARRRLDDAARTDALTGLGNRRAFDERIALELAHATRYGTPLSLLVLDLTGFKGVNDRLGHAAGDAALCAVAAALRASARAADGVYRWGGDEFAVILERADGAAALRAAARFTRVIEGLSVGGAPLGANVGTATHPRDGDDVDTLLRVADGRMYAAKGAGVPYLDDPA